jgi:chorismate synthase
VNWQQTMYVEAEKPEGTTGANRADVTRPRPGHATWRARSSTATPTSATCWSAASARETAARVAAGSLARQLLARFDVQIASHVSAHWPFIDYPSSSYYKQLFFSYSPYPSSHQY